ncbi:asparagine synthase C-terminal domain-containing protein [Candidatus Halobonum tyrrellensis]|uniref:asparagine synthase C-terminal domain-containing protein n=1 Tax=Candidatus Halobonum tyrrellensis TaxID=1431545 RepID=UPI000677F1F4|nr:asparagine synthase-related protein [Candidatus Halobonum tyrrellensis]
MDGADPGTVRTALAAADPLPGTDGFAGECDGTLVRDVLGRRPLFVDADSEAWAFDPTDLRSPETFPAGHARADGATERVWSLPDPAPAPAAEALAAVERAVLTAVRGADPAGTAVAFSGGVDSGLVAAGLPDAPLYVAGFEGCHDVEAARAAADAMGRADDLRVVEVTHDDLRRAVPELVAATGRTNPMDVSIALPLYLVAERAAADGHDRLAVGQGADELFGGYAKVVDPVDDGRVDADTVRGARRETLLALPDGLERDVLTLRAAGVDPVAPLLGDEVVAAALELPADLLATPDERKVALRRAAAGVLPESVRAAEKKAVQYGTYVSRELDRLARRAGFKRRMENHVGRYVESLVE